MKIAVVLYDAVEPIDLAVVGVLSMATRVTDQLEYFTVSENGGAVVLQNGLKVLADHSFDTAPAADVIIVTGGPGWKQQAVNPAMADFLRRRKAHTEIMASVCTGSMILAASGLLDGKQATTKFEVVAPEQSPLEELSDRFGVESTAALVVDEGDIVTGGGVTLGIDTTLYLLERVLGKNVARETARIMEYRAALEANQQRLSTLVAVDHSSTS
ncbi:DJ-1/PfpI family protein [Paraburkholderia phosphatilytica]|uniref:DJ-1/PfpI family protein n=1 Tax=Paraburkholderia phosphatilytica TaxID=2282883 RepID=UPI000E53CDC0|nr:DJ-1/PfpI family protein [Paraburkholderia phosphatilytica]